jgi:hypothetical protein
MNLLKLALWLEGKKTYTVAAGIVLLALSQFFLGNATLAEAVNEALKGLGLAALRAGVSKAAAPTSGDDKRTEQLTGKTP